MIYVLSYFGPGRWVWCKERGLSWPGWGKEKKEEEAVILIVPSEDLKPPYRAHFERFYHF